MAWPDALDVIPPGRPGVQLGAEHVEAHTLLATFATLVQRSFGTGPVISVAELATGAARLAADLANLEAAHAGTAAALAALTAEVADVDGRLGSVETLAAAHTGRLDAAGIRLDANDVALAGLQRNVAEITTNLGVLDLRVGANETALASLAPALDALTGRVDRLEVLVAALGPLAELTPEEIADLLDAVNVLAYSPRGVLATVVAGSAPEPTGTDFVELVSADIELVDARRRLAVTAGAEIHKTRLFGAVDVQLRHDDTVVAARRLSVGHGLTVPVVLAATVAGDIGPSTFSVWVANVDEFGTVTATDAATDPTAAATLTVLDVGNHLALVPA